MKKFYLLAFALGAFASSLSAQTSTSALVQQHDTAYVVNSDKAAYTSATGWEILWDVYAHGTPGATLVDNDKVNMTCGTDVYMHYTDGYHALVAAALGVEDTKGGFINLGSNTAFSNNLNDSTAAKLSYQAVSELNSSWQSVVTVTPKVAGKLGMKVFGGDNNRTIFVYKAATEDEMDNDYFGEVVAYKNYKFEDGETNPASYAYLKTSVEANRTYWLVGASNKNQALWEIDFVPSGEVNGINAPDASEKAQPAAIYTINGMLVKNLKKGINIVRMNDGSVRKVILK